MTEAPPEASEVDAPDAPPLRHYDSFMRTIVARRWADRLSATMDALNVTAVDLARQTGVSKTTITMIRNGKRMPGGAVRLAIAVALGADVEQIFPSPLRQDYLDYVGQLDGVVAAA